jgi:addiction module RelE/StbE family toxin
VRLVFAQRFRDELRREYRFIRERNGVAATDVRSRILETVKRLKTFPQSGRSWRTEGTWELLIPRLPYIVIYEIDGDRVVVLTLFHTAREFPERIH